MADQADDLGIPTKLVRPTLCNTWVMCPEVAFLLFGGEGHYLYWAASVGEATEGRRGIGAAVPPVSPKVF